MTPAQLIKTRKRLGLSQAQLAEELGVSRPTVTRWENGTHPINATTEKLIGLLKGRRTA